MSDEKQRITLYMVNETICAYEFSIMLLTGEYPNIVAEHQNSIAELKKLRTRIEQGEVVKL